MSIETKHPTLHDPDQLTDEEVRLRAANTKGLDQRLGESVDSSKGIGTSPSGPGPGQDFTDDTTQARVLAHYRAGEAIMRFFLFTHLAPAQRAVSRGWALKALEVCDTLPRSGERAAGLRKLMEAKDCFVRASLPEPA